MHEWREVRLGEIAEIYDGPHATPQKTDDGPIFLGISNLSRGRLDLSNTEHVSESDFHHWTRRVEPQEGDVVFSYETRIGEAAIVPPGLRCCLGRRTGLLRARGDGVDPRFLLYAYLGPAFQGTLHSQTVNGSTVDRIPLIDMPQFPILIPADIQEQRRIAHILGTLDDKIENNRKTAKTLEAMAQAIFKSWFVDFDPVRAKASGESMESICKRLKITPEILSLFPDGFEDSELGKIPRGWKVGSIEDLCESVSSGGTPDRTNPTYWLNGTIPWYKTGELRDGPLIASEEYITEDALNRSACNLWPIGTILFALYASPTIGRLGVLTKPGTSNQAAAGLIVKTNYGTPFLKRVLLLIRDEFRRIAVGAAQQNINLRVLKSQHTLIPESHVTSKFSSISGNFDANQIKLFENAESLTSLRDALLPKLISGELRVDAAEELTEESIG